MLSQVATRRSPTKGIDPNQVGASGKPSTWMSLISATASRTWSARLNPSHTNGTATSNIQPKRKEAGGGGPPPAEPTGEQTHQRPAGKCQHRAPEQRRPERRHDPEAGTKQHQQQDLHQQAIVIEHRVSREEGCRKR